MIKWLYPPAAASGPFPGRMRKLLQKGLFFMSADFTCDLSCDQDRCLKAMYWEKKWYSWLYDNVRLYVISYQNRIMVWHLTSCYNAHIWTISTKWESYTSLSDKQWVRAGGCHKDFYINATSEIYHSVSCNSVPPGVSSGDPWQDWWDRAHTHTHTHTHTFIT